jgi:hypothetical protein
MVKKREKNHDGKVININQQQGYRFGEKKNY